MDKINPKHYQWLNGMQAIDVCEQCGFNLGNVLKYVLRSAGPLESRKHSAGTEDLRKAAWYLEREIKRRDDAESQQIKSGTVPL